MRKSGGPGEGLRNVLLVAGFILMFLGARSNLTTGDSDCGDGLAASPHAYCYFSHTGNASLGLNATIWFQYLINDSKVWEWYGNLTWAFDPNLAFWAFVYEDVARLTDLIAPGRSVEVIWWGLPFPDEHWNRRTQGYVVDYNNGTYDHAGIFVNQYPFNGSSGGDVAAENYTLIVRGAVPLLPSEHWIAKIWWITEGLSDAQWAKIADRLSTRLNATWYMESCHFDKVPYYCNGTAWPVETVFLGFLVLLGFGSKRRRSRRKEML